MSAEHRLVVRPDGALVTSASSSAPPMVRRLQQEVVRLRYRCAALESSCERAIEQYPRADAMRDVLSAALRDARLRQHEGV